MDDNRRHFELFTKEKLVDLLYEKETRIEELTKRLDYETRTSAKAHVCFAEAQAANLEYRTQINLMAEKLGKREAQNTDFDNSLVMEASDSLREIAGKVTEEAEAEYAMKMTEIGLNAELHHQHMTLGTQMGIAQLQAEVAKSQHGVCVEQVRIHNDVWKNGYVAETAKAHAIRDRWISMYSHQTVQTGIRWIIGATALVSGVYLYLSF